MNFRLFCIPIVLSVAATSSTTIAMSPSAHSNTPNIPSPPPLTHSRETKIAQTEADCYRTDFNDDDVNLCQDYVECTTAAWHVYEACLGVSLAAGCAYIIPGVAASVACYYKYNQDHLSCNQKFSSISRALQTPQPNLCDPEHPEWDGR
jgi:hypothetical protein